ncbi:MAG: 4Fe-4S binding protein [Planctomycetota bacterium]
MAKKTNLNDFASKLLPWRMWVQSLFLLVWLDPMGWRLHGICSPVFHCYSCPLATFACPIGILANFSALHIFPFIAVGTLVLVGALLGSLTCGWACPFGLLQDLVAKVPTRKLDLPQWTGYFRYVVLLTGVLALPYFFGDDSWLFICRICPAGALEAAFPNVAKLAVAGKSIVWPSAVKIIVLILVLAAMFFSQRPWCRVFCPLGAIFGLFNRTSVLFLRLDTDKCNDCKQCHKLCEYGIDPTKNPNDSRCIRCLECTKCKSDAITINSIFRNR